jgi:predicted aspartyl protease
LIKGSVSADGTREITVNVAGRDWQAVIDTGFNGDLELPEQLRADLNAIYIGEGESTLAGGVTITEDLYVVEFPFDGRIVQAQATFVSHGEILIGTHLIASHILRVDFPSGRVRLTRGRTRR